MTEFVDGWFLGHTLGEGAYGEYVYLFTLSLPRNVSFVRYLYLSREQTGRAIWQSFVLDIDPDWSISMKF